MACILIAEDETDIRNLISFTLTFGGHQVIETANGEQALQAAIDHKPDLVLLDVRMPRLSGYETCERIKKNDLIKNIPVVFLSAKGQESEIKTGIEKGAQEYILKPFSPEQLLKRVNDIVAKKSREDMATT
ncbi:MAG TPA: response regulator [Anaerolineales bacterium]|nr:response regulator [Anaerolineales bacterium]